MAAIDEIICWMKTVGIRVSEHCRLSHFKRVLERTARGEFEPGPDTKKAARLQLISRFETAELLRIKNTFSHFHNRPEAIRRLKRIVKDPVLAEHNDTNSFGRDAQEELSVAATLEQGGATITICEPDIICDINQFRYAIAVKRVKSAKNWEQNVKQADGQIRKAGGLGVVSLELSQAIGAYRKVYSVNNSAELRAACLRYADDFLAKDIDVIRDILDPKIHLGVVIRFAAHALVRGIGPSTTQYCDVIHFDTNKPYRTMAIRSLRESFQRGGLLK